MNPNFRVLPEHAEWYKTCTASGSANNYIPAHICRRLDNHDTSRDFGDDDRIILILYLDKRLYFDYFY